MFSYTISTLIPALLIAANAAHAQHVMIEPGAVISSTAEMPNSTLHWMVDPAVGMIRASGHRCDSISAIRPAVVSSGLTVVCNGNRYAYDIEDHGGRWQVELQ